MACTFAYTVCALATCALLYSCTFVAPSGRVSMRGSEAQFTVSQPKGASQVEGQDSSWSTGSAACVAGAGIVIAVSLAGSARGKLSKSRRASNVARNFNKESQLGAQPPLGFWDPLDLCKDEATFKDFRTKELKHGRLAMMGAVGMLVQSLVQVPGMEGVPKDVSACLVGNGQIGFFGVLAIIGGLEAAVFVQDENKEPGNFGNPLPWFDDYSDEMRARELNNGRIAMFAAIGQIAAGLYTGKDAMQQFGL